MTVARCRVDAKAALGETPVWSQAEGCLYWIDCPSGRLHRFDPSEGRDRAVPLAVEGYLGSFALRRDGGFLALAGKALWSLDGQGGSPRCLAEVEAERPDNLPNDGKCDPAGRFLFGTMHRSSSEPSGVLYSFDGRAVTQLDSGFACANGMDWSPDGKIFYFVDMMTSRVLAYDYDAASGRIANRRTLFTVPSNEGLPDGLCTDREGSLWVAHWDGWCISRWAADGRRLARLEMPVPRPTCPVFGGRDGRTLYVTSSAADLSPEILARAPQSGGLFALDVGVAGRPPHAFAG